MKNNFQIGQKLLWIIDEFDGKSEVECIVTKVYDDHYIARSIDDDMDIWIEKENPYPSTNRFIKI